VKRAIHTNRGAACKGPYSQGIVASGQLLYVAAQGPIDPATGQVIGDTFEEQAARAFENVKAIVEAAGATMADVVKVTVYLADWQHLAALNAVYRRFFSEPYPARTPVQSNLPMGLIMVDAVAALPDENRR
jgi:2-iminobutanoate/2-iminopropanoate deaminase